MIVQQQMRQRVKSMTLRLEYPDGESAVFDGRDLLADVTFSTPGWPPLDAQDAAPYAIVSTVVRKLVIEVTLDLQGKLSVETHPADLASDSHLTMEQ